jgi:hydroxycarboxylate dehydrogenase B
MPNVAPDELRAIGRAVFSAIGSPDEVAGLVADSLVDANLAGHDSHGVIRIPSYVQMAREGRVAAEATPVVTHETPTTAVVDGRWGFGQVTARRSMEVAVEKARASGIGAVSAVACNHIGRLGEWAELAATNGMVGFVTVALHGGSQAAAPFGGAERVMSTNPLAFGIPGPNGSVASLVDFATTAVAEGKLRVARAKGAQVPPGSIQDAEGRPTTDPNDFYNGGMLLPFGGHKGYGLAVTVELLGLALTGAFGHRRDAFASGSFCLAISPEAFGSREGYEEAVAEITQRIKAVRPAPGFEAVLLPGEPEQRARAARSAGVPIEDATWQALQATMAELGVRQK